MHKAEVLAGIEGKRMLRESDAMQYTGMGRTSFRKWARDIGAVRKFGEKAVRYDKNVIDAEFDRMALGEDA